MDPPGPTVTTLTPADARQIRVLGELGRGSFGVVWHAELTGAEGFRKEVAIKVLHRGRTEEDTVRRLRDEARILGLIRHPGVVQVDDLIQIEGRWAVLMEFVEGIDLDVGVRAGPVPARVALEITSEVARVLAAAWSTPGPSGQPLRVIHRDIKPSNIKITRNGAVKVLDFGVARAEFARRESKTALGTFGTVQFMAPERLAWVDGPEGDVYALGAVLYELLSGQPFGRTSTSEEQHLGKLKLAMARLRRFLPSPDPGVEALVMSMMDFREDRRLPPRDLEDRCDHLAETLGGERLKRWAEREVPERAAFGRSEDRDTVLPAMVEMSGGVFSARHAEGARVALEHLDRAAPPPTPAPAAGGGPLGAAITPAALLVAGLLTLLIAVAVLAAGWAWLPTLQGVRAAPRPPPTASP